MQVSKINVFIIVIIIMCFISKNFPSGRSTCSHMVESIRKPLYVSVGGAVLMTGFNGRMAESQKGISFYYSCRLITLFRAIFL